MFYYVCLNFDVFFIILIYFETIVMHVLLFLLTCGLREIYMDSRVFSYIVINFAITYSRTLWNVAKWNESIFVDVAVLLKPIQHISSCECYGLIGVTLEVVWEIVLAVITIRNTGKPNRFMDLLRSTPTYEMVLIRILTIPLQKEALVLLETLLNCPLTLYWTVHHEPWKPCRTSGFPIALF